MSPFPADTTDSSRLEFFPSPVPAGSSARYVVVFVVLPEGFLVADIGGRGWCVPSGRIEEGETPVEAACRETLEEAGYQVAGLQSVGCFRMTSQGGTSYAEAFLTTDAQETGPPTGDDSLGRRAVPLSGLPTLYYRWGPFYEAVFGHMAGLVSG